MVTQHHGYAICYRYSWHAISWMDGQFTLDTYLALDNSGGMPV